MAMRRIRRKILMLLLVFVFLAVAIAINLVLEKPDEQNHEGPATASSENHTIYEIDDGDTLLEAIANLRTREYESILGFDMYGKKLFNYTCYLPTTVYCMSSTRDAFERQGGTLIVHNHPSGSSFSSTDLHTEALRKTPKLMIISDRYIYLLEPGERGWGDADEISKYYTRCYEIRAKEITQCLKNIQWTADWLLNYEEGEDDGSAKWFCLHEMKAGYLKYHHADFQITTGHWTTNQTMIDVAEKFGMKYQRILTDEFDLEKAGIFQTESSKKEQEQVGAEIGSQDQVEVGTGEQEQTTPVEIPGYTSPEIPEAKFDLSHIIDDILVPRRKLQRYFA